MKRSNYLDAEIVVKVELYICFQVEMNQRRVNE